MSSDKQKNNPIPNLWSFLIEVSKGVFALINNDKIYPLFGLIFIAFSAYIFSLMPESDVAYVVKAFVDRALGGELPLIVMLVLSNYGWAYLYNKMRQQDKEEIKRLSEIRSQLIHPGSGVLIQEHRSSEGDCEERYVIPSKLAQKPKDKQK